jgi:hypothetical protein
MTKLNPSIKHHLLIGAFISSWIFLFAFFIRPFEHGNMTFYTWVMVSIAFSTIAFLSYTLLSIIQNLVYQRISRWNTGFEITSIVFFYIPYSIGSYVLYKGYLINGYYDFFEFFSKIILTSALIFVPILILSRRYSIKLIPIKEEVILITGENKLDILKIKKSDLVSVSNSQNYVEISYTDGIQLKTKLIRTSLKKIQIDFDFLIKVHRSHLINPSHFKSWKNQNTISLTQMELPVSKNYKNRLMSL